MTATVPQQGPPAQGGPSGVRLNDHDHERVDICLHDSDCAVPAPCPCPCHLVARHRDAWRADARKAIREQFERAANLATERGEYAERWQWTHQRMAEGAVARLLAGGFDTFP